MLTPLILSLFFVFSLCGKQGWEVCRKDRETYCPDVEFSQLHQCMRSHWHALSKPCKDRILEKHEQTKHEGDSDPHVACAQDRTTYCSSAHTFEEIRQCIRTNWNSLSEPCRTAIEKHHRHHEEEKQTTVELTDKPIKDTEVPKNTHMETKTESTTPRVRCPRKLCAKDIETFCNAKEGTELTDCLKRHWESLSSQCTNGIVAYLKTVSGASEDLPTSEDTTEATIEASIEEHDKSDGYHGGDNEDNENSTPHWTTVVMRYWWIYPVGLVFIIQIVACYRIRQIRRAAQTDTKVLP